MSIMMLRHRLTATAHVRNRAFSSLVPFIDDGINHFLNDISSDLPIISDPVEYRKVHQIRLKSPPGLKNDYIPMTDFNSAPFSDILKGVLIDEGFVAPTPTQAQSWPIALEMRDMISVARTGSGKTCAFLLPAFQQLLIAQEKLKKEDAEYDVVTYKKHGQSPTILVLVPTRELAVQIELEAKKFSLACDLVTTCLYGGVPKADQIMRLQAGVDLVIATPGRCIDLATGKNLDISKVSYLVLDEADRMLDMGFEPQIRRILEKIPIKRQNLFFSATWPMEVQSLAEEFLRNPIQINIGDSGVLNANKAIYQHIMVMKEHEKTDQLMILLKKLHTTSNYGEAEEVFEEELKEGMNGEIKKENDSSIIIPNTKSFPKTIIFVGRRADCDQLVRILSKFGHSADSLHGDKTQIMRDKAMDKFRSGSSRILVATDVASRGLDVKDIEIVINYDFPLSASGVEDYVHRIGRTARGNNKGSAYTFFTQRDGRLAGELSQLLGRCRQTTPTALKELARENSAGIIYGNDDAKRSRALSNGRGVVTKVSQPFKPLSRPAIKKHLSNGHEKTCKGENIGRRNNGQYESSSPSNRGGGSGRATIEKNNMRTMKKKKITEDYGDY